MIHLICAGKTIPQIKEYFQSGMTAAEATKPSAKPTEAKTE